MPLRQGYSSVRLALVVATTGLLAGIVWVAAGDALPRGRWFAVHLFTLGVLSPLILALSQHFAATLTRTQEGATASLVITYSVGAVGVLVGVGSGTRGLLVGGATVVVGAVVVARLRLRRARRDATGARFVWVVRLYERAHDAFVLGATIGALLGALGLNASWFVAARLTHLHANLLGWGVLTLLATLPFFGPTVLRRQIVAGADEHAARTLRHGATGLGIGLLALLLTGLGGTVGIALRLVAATGLAVFAWVGTGVCRPIIRTAVRGSPSPGRWPIAGTCAWLAVGLWADATVVGIGAWRWMDALGALAITGVLLQALLGAVLHLAPVAFGRDRPHRDALRDRVDRGSGLRAASLNLGVALIVLTAALRPLVDDPPLAAIAGRTGWVLVALAVVTLPIALAPLARRQRVQV